MEFLERLRHYIILLSLYIFYIFIMNTPGDIDIKNRLWRRHHKQLIYNKFRKVIHLSYR